MESFALGVKKRGRRRRGPQGVKNGDIRRAAVLAFGDTEDSDDSQPRAKPISRIVTSVREDVKVEKNIVTKLGASPRIASREDGSTNSGPKQSQIAKLVARRKGAEHGLEVLVPSREGKDSAMFKYDVDKCPEHSGLAAYRSTPVDGFGASMLKAMGWKGLTDEDGKEGASLERKPRPPRLGLGATLGEMTVPGTKRGKEALPGSNGVDVVVHLGTERNRGNSSEDETSGKREKRKREQTIQERSAPAAIAAPNKLGTSPTARPGIP